MGQITDYEWLSQFNLCHKCRKETVAPGKKYCFECLDKIREDSRKRYDPEKAKQYQKRRRELYEEHKVAGICVRCNKVATHGMYCYDHMIKVKRHNRDIAERRKRERHEKGLVPDYRKENGLCLFCGKPIEEENVKKGFLICQTHREMASNNSRKAVNNPYRLATEADLKLMRARNGRKREKTARI